MVNHKTALDYLKEKLYNHLHSFCECGGTAYTADLKSAGESLGVQIPPFAPRRNEFRSFRFFSYNEKNQSPAALFRLFRKKVSLRLRCSLASALTTLLLATNFLRFQRLAKIELKSGR